MLCSIIENKCGVAILEPLIQCPDSLNAVWAQMMPGDERGLPVRCHDQAPHRTYFRTTYIEKSRKPSNGSPDLQFAELAVALGCVCALVI